MPCHAAEVNIGYCTLNIHKKTGIFCFSLLLIDYVMSNNISVSKIITWNFTFNKWAFFQYFYEFIMHFYHISCQPATLSALLICKMECKPRNKTWKWERLKEISQVPEIKLFGHSHQIPLFTSASSSWSCHVLSWIFNFQNSHDGVLRKNIIIHERAEKAALWSESADLSLEICKGWYISPEDCLMSTRAKESWLEVWKG